MGSLTPLISIVLSTFSWSPVFGPEHVRVRLRVLGALRVRPFLQSAEDWTAQRHRLSHPHPATMRPYRGHPYSNTLRASSSIHRAPLPLTLVPGRRGAAVPKLRAGRAGLRWCVLRLSPRVVPGRRPDTGPGDRQAGAARANLPAWGCTRKGNPLVIPSHPHRRDGTLLIFAVWDVIYAVPSSVGVIPLPYHQLLWQA